MTVSNRLYIVVVVFVALGTRVDADGDVTVITPSSATSASSSDKAVASDGTAVIHKSLHKKKKKLAEATAVTPAYTPSVATATPIYPAPPQVTVAATATVDPSPVSPTVETGLPVGRYPGTGMPIQGVSTFIPAPATLPAAKSSPAFFALMPSTVMPPRSATPMAYTTPARSSSAPDDFVFTNFTKKIKNYYPWKTDIITTEFWIGEGATPISSTTNEASAWDLDWRSSNSGADSPYDRDPNGYASGRHASTVNPFYVALPFNDLAFPDKAHEWLPRGWHRPPKDGKQVSACKDRWVEIKNAQGKVCYAQWEDVGPLRYDHAEYVFGEERPIGLGDDHAGLDVSPAVADCLHVNDRNRVTSWRFVDDEDVRPGPWLLLDEQAVIYTALHQLKTFRSSPELPIQGQSEPTDDPSNLDSNKKKVDASKG